MAIVVGEKKDVSCRFSNSMVAGNGNFGGFLQEYPERQLTLKLAENGVITSARIVIHHNDPLTRNIISLSKSLCPIPKSRSPYLSPQRRDGVSWGLKEVRALSKRSGSREDQNTRLPFRKFFFHEGEDPLGIEIGLRSDGKDNPRIFVPSKMTVGGRIV